jgi:hypothetical protein
MYIIRICSADLCFFDLDLYLFNLLLSRFLFSVIFAFVLDRVMSPEKEDYRHYRYQQMMLSTSTTAHLDRVAYRLDTTAGSAGFVGYYPLSQIA